MKVKNKRKNPRAPVNFKILTIYEDSIKIFYLKNISKTGAFIETLAPFEFGSVVQVLFSLNNIDQVVNIQARVVRSVKPESEAQNYVLAGMGIEFIGIDFKNESLIEDYITYIMPIYDEINILLAHPKKNIDRLDFLLAKIGHEKYNDFFELKENIKYICLSLGLINN